MKKTFFGILFGLALVLSAQTANAQVLEFFAELPLQYSFDEGGSADSVSGFTAGVRSFFLPVGLGIDRYTIDVGAGSEIDIEFFNLFYASVFPFFDLALGIGVGQASYDPALSSSFEDADLFQYYINAGFPFAPFLGVFVGFHFVSGSGDARAGGTTDLDVGGRMTSIGIRFGF